MKRIIAVAACLAAAVCTAAGDLPQVSVREWTDSLDIVDVDGAAASLSYACVIDSEADGSVPEHDSAYDSWKMEFEVSFDRAVKGNDVVLYGQIHSSQTGIWSLIGAFAGEQKNQCWHPVKLPATAAGSKVSLIATLLSGGSDPYYVAYNYNRLPPFFSAPYALSFAGLIEQFWCGISFRSREYLGTTCTIDVVLVNPDKAADRRTLATIQYRYDGGRYRDTDPGRWFNTRIGWYDQLPRDLDKCQNCTVTNLEDCLELAAPGKLDCDGATVVHALALAEGCVRYPASVKRMTVVVDANSFGWSTFDQMVKQYETGPLGGCRRTAALFFYAEDGVTNMAGLVRMGDTNGIARLTGAGAVDWSGDLTCAITVRRRPLKFGPRPKFATTVSYEANGVSFAYEGRSDIPVVEYAVEDKFAIAGTAVVSECYGDMERLPVGHIVGIE